MTTTDDAQHDRALADLIRQEPRDLYSLGTLALRPDMAGPVAQYFRYIREDGVLDPLLKERIREHIYAMEKLVADEGDWAEAPPGHEDAQTRVALEFVHGMATDFQATGEDHDLRARLGQHFSTAEIVELGMFSGAHLALRRVGGAIGTRLARHIEESGIRA